MVEVVSQYINIYYEKSMNANFLTEKQNQSSPLNRMFCWEKLTLVFVFSMTAVTLIIVRGFT